MKNSYRLLLLLLLPLGMQAQVLKHSPSQIDFGITLTNKTDSLAIEIENPAAYDVKVKDVEVFHPAFTIKDTAFEIKAGQTHSFYVYFHPRHNLYHNTEIVVMAEGRAGNLSINLLGQGRYPESYYRLTENLSQEALKSMLKNIIDDHISLGYNGARDVMYGNIDNDSGVVECVYTGRKATFSTRAGAVDNDFNAEHTFPQSFFNSNNPMQSDLHHLFPTDEMANNRRSNYPFGYVSNPTWQEGGSKLGNSIFEPRNVHKGDVARALFYFVIRYQDYNNFVRPQETVLREWYALDTPDQKEIARNEDIFSYQKNRNPFVDHPEFLERISSITQTAVAPEIVAYEVPVPLVNIEDAVQDDSLVYGFPIVNTGNQTLTIIFPAFIGNNSPIREMSIPVQIEPGETGMVLFTVPDMPASTVLDTFVANISDKEIRRIPIRIQSKSGVGIAPVASLDVKIYPNPVRETLYFQLNTNGRPAQVQVINATGQVVATRTYTSTSTGAYTLEANTLPSGIYWMQVIAGGQRQSLPFVKE